MEGFARQMQVRRHILAAIAAWVWTAAGLAALAKRPCYGAFDFIAFGVDKQPLADSEQLQEWLE